MTSEEIEETIRSHDSYVRLLADWLLKKFRPRMSWDFLYNAGLVGLWDAASRYDSRRSSFKTYARYRIIGEMLEECRRQNGRHGQHRRLLSLEALGDDIEISDRHVWDAACRDSLDSLLARLPARLQYIVRRVNLDGATLKDCGRELGISESRICQLRKIAFRILRRERPPLLWARSTNARWPK